MAGLPTPKTEFLPRPHTATFNFDGHCNGRLTRKVEGVDVQTKEWGQWTDTHQTEMGHKCMSNTSQLSITSLSTAAAGGRPHLHQEEAQREEGG